MARGPQHWLEKKAFLQQRVFIDKQQLVQRHDSSLQGK